VTTCSSGSWSTSCPVCILPGSCTTEPSCTNATTLDSGIADGDTRTYTCVSGTAGTPNFTDLTCNSGSWTGSCPVCTLLPGSCTETRRTCVNATKTGSGLADGDTRTYTCDAGFAGSPNATDLTCASGSWVGSCPTCVASGCVETRLTCTNATKTGSGLAEGDTRTYTCDAGFTGSPNATDLTCTTGSWIGSCPTCVQSGCAETLRTCVNATKTGSGLADGDIRTYTCDAGYVGTPNATDLTCSAGSWIGVCPTCVTSGCVETRRTCVDATKSGSGLAEGDTRTFTCDPGFSGTPNATDLTCSAGSWIGDCPTCAPSSCVETLRTCVDATKSGSGLAEGDTRTFTCDPGFTGTPNATDLTCTSGSWIGSCPTCVPSSCVDIRRTCTNATVSGTGLAEGDTRTFTCDPGFAGNPNATDFTCSSGSWVGDCPTCVSGTCGSPPPTCVNATISGSGIDVGDTRAYTCVPGSTEDSPGGYSCLADGTWGGVCPTCTLLPGSCTVDPPSWPCANATMSGSSVADGSTRTFTCSSGYAGSPNSTDFTCSAGSWAGFCPTCLPSSCTGPTSCPNASTSDTGTANGSTRLFSCDTGYTGTPSSLTCSLGTWDTNCPACTIVDCGAAPSCASSPATGIGSGTTYRSSRIYYCDAGYNGTSTLRTCLANGSWDGICPNNCTQDCNRNTSCTNASTTDTGTADGARRRYTCNAGFTGTPSSLTCTAGDWDTNCPTCTPSGCSSTTSCANASTTDTGTADGATRLYSCDAGFTGSSSSLTCSLGAWDNNCPTCVPPPTCSDAPTCANATATGSGSNEGDRRAYACDSGYSGFSTENICTSGLWVGSCPDCRTLGSCSNNTPTCANATMSGSGTSGGSVRTYTCDAGYTGSPDTFTCSSGYWVGSCPICL
jgi:CUB/sushi domain-containing protein